MSATSARWRALGAAIVMMAGVTQAASQEEFPAREIRVICAFPAGSGADVFARFFAEGMKPAFSKNIIVENRVGASGNLATNYVARAKPDGYTIFIHAPSALAAWRAAVATPQRPGGRCVRDRFA